MLSYSNNLLKVFLLLLACNKVVTFNIDVEPVNITDMSSYLQHINHEIFINKTYLLTVVCSVHHKRAKYYINALLTEYSKTLNEVNLRVRNVNPSYKHTFGYFTVMFIDSYDSFRRIDPGPSTATQNFSEYYVIIYYSLSKEPEKEIQKIFDYCWQYYTVNVAILLKTDHGKSILLYTYYPFTKKSCKNAQMHIINRNKSILQMTASEIFPNKFKSFHNCTLVAALWNVPPYLILPEEGSISRRLSGIEGYLLNVLANVLNFQIDYVTPPNNEQRGYVKADGTLTGAIKMLNERTADLSLGSFRCTLERSTALSPSRTFYQTMQVLTVLALHQPWSSLEIIAYPFEFHIWIVLMIIVLFVLTSVHILHSYRPDILRFIYGFRSVYLININILAITFNQTAHILPQRNFARYMCLMWILLTMILRSIYQGSLYDFLTTQEHLPPPNTVDDLIRRGYTLIVNTATNNTYSGIPVIRDKLLQVVIMDIADSGGFPLLEANPDKRYATGTPRDFLTYYATLHGKNGVFHVLKETVFAQHLCVHFTKHSYLVKPFERVLTNLRYFGLIDHWAESLLDSSFLETVDNSKTKNPLTLSQLSGIVLICMYLHGIAFIVFICEILWFELKLKRGLVDNIILT